MKYLVVIISGMMLYATTTIGQPPSTLHVVTFHGNIGWPLKFKFDVNGVRYTLNPGESMNISLQSDSVFIDVHDSRTVKTITYDLRTAAQPDINAWIYYGKNKGSSIRHFYARQDIDCFDELKKGCIRTINVTIP